MENVVFNIYQKIGDYFTGTQKRRLCAGFLIVVFVIVFWASQRLGIVAAEDTLYWVFGSLLQALLALVALIGVVSIFKLQDLNETKLRLLVEGQKPQYSMHLGQYSEIGALHAALVAYLDAHPDNQLIYITRLKKEIDELVMSRRIVSEYAVKLTVYTFFVVILSLLCLILTPFLAGAFLGYPSLYLIFILSSYSLFLVAKGVAYSIKF